MRAIAAEGMERMEDGAERDLALKHHLAKWYGRLTVVGAGLIALVLLWMVLPVDEWLSRAVWHMFDLRGWGALVYFLLYVILVAVSFPTTPLNVGAGILFPFWLGAGIALAAGFVSAIVSFLLVRFVARNWIRSRLRRLPHCGDIMRLMENAGLQLVILIRLNPFIPAGFKNYGFSMAGVPFRTYLLGTALGQTPVTLVHVYLGWAGGLAIMAGEDPLTTRNYVFLGLGAALSVALLLLISWYGRKKTLDKD